MFARCDWNYARPHRPAIAAGDTTDFGRAAHNYFAASAALLAARAHEGVATAAIAGHGAPTIPLGSLRLSDTIAPTLPIECLANHHFAGIEPA